MDPNITNYSPSNRNNTVMQTYKQNFDDNYDGSRAPFALYLHYHWFFKNNNNTSGYEI